MDIERRGLLAAAAAVAASGSRTLAWAEPGLQALTNEPSRAQLFERVEAAALAEDPAAAAEGQRNFNLYGPFRFPNDVLFDVTEQKPRSNSLFGVDISHYTNSTFPIEQLAQRKALFLYMKATQGTRSYDAKFAPFYKRALALPRGSQVHPGAYHFLSAGSSGLDQARFFVRVLGNSGALVGGKLRDTDMPPVMDLEWDVASANGPDRWAPHKAADILQQSKDFLEEVERQTGRKPMIYTARVWWMERIGTDDLGPLAGYPLWLADYSKTSRAGEKPRTIAGAKHALWQFTAAATMALGFNGGFDANVYKGPPEDFYPALGVKRFA